MEKQRLEEQLATLTNQYRALEEKYNTVTSTGDPIQYLGQQLEAHEKTIKDLQLKCKMYEKVGMGVGITAVSQLTCVDGGYVDG